MENNNKNKKFIISLIGIMILILFSIGMVYAFFNYTKTGQRNNVLNTANLNFSFEDSEWIWIENAYPITTQEALTLETTGNSDITEVDGGIAQFKVTGGHNSGAIHYYLSLINEELTSTITSKNNRFTLDPSTKSGKLPDGAISINLQTATSNIFETTGLVDDVIELLNPGNSFEPSYTGSYINTEDSVTIRELPLVGGSQIERVLGNGIISGNTGTRYFELRMWINDTVLMNDELRVACLTTTSPSDVNTYGVGYCDSSTPNLPEGIKYVYSSGEFAKLYYSNKIKVQTTDVTNGVVDTIPPITRRITTDNTVKNDSSFTNLYANISGTADSGLLKMTSTDNSPYPIYFFRGSVQNNHLIFANMCWRIVRTTETGGTKLIYEGKPIEGVCDNRDFQVVDNAGSYTGNSNNPSYLRYLVSSGVIISSQTIYDNTTVLAKNVKYIGDHYELVDYKTFSNTMTSFSDTSILDYRYFCYGNTTSCNTVRYALSFYTSSSYVNAKYVELSTGGNGSGIVDSMLHGTNIIMPSSLYVENNDFYSKNLLSYAGQIEDTVFCNDMSTSTRAGFEPGTKAGIGVGYKFGVNERLIDNKNPTLDCPYKGDRFTVSKTLGNGMLKYPIGALTADEYAFAGAVYGIQNPNIYLNVSNLGTWTLTPINYGGASSKVMFFNADGDLAGAIAYNGYYIRPVISLKSTEVIKSGTGTSNDPYIVE